LFRDGSPDISQRWHVPFFLPLRCLRHACCGFKTAVCEPSNP
jgi:hypothetical protein